MDDTPAPDRKPRNLMTFVDRSIERTARANEDERVRRREAEAKRESDATHAEHERPRTRGDCVDGPRPCPWVGCRHALYLEASGSGTVKLAFPDREPLDLDDSCALDVADRGGITLEEVGAVLNLTRERVRQIETSGLRALSTYRRRLT